MPPVRTIAQGLEPGHDGTVTLVEGSAFCISGRSGDIAPGSPQGLFYRDARLLARFELRLNGQSPEPLVARATDPFSSVHTLRPRLRTGRPSSPVLVVRERHVGRGMREDLRIENHGGEPSFCSLELSVAADFADITEVREGTVPSQGDVAVEVAGHTLTFRLRRGPARRAVHLRFGPEARIDDDGCVTFEVIVPARGTWSTCIQVVAEIDGHEVTPRHLCGQPVDRAAPAERLARWRKGTPLVETDHEPLRRAIQRSVDDLGALRIFDPEHPTRTMVAAGAPWLMAVYGRDSLLTSWMALPVDPELALGTLQALALHQGRRNDPRTEEEPGRILHELRFGEGGPHGLGGPVSYGSADSTPLFVMLLGELRRWGLGAEAVDALLPHADRAIAWLQAQAERFPHGYIAYQRASDAGVYHQAWKDTADGVRFADGTVARPPLALAEVQAYTYGAFLARAHFASEVGDVELAGSLRARALRLKEAFNRDFWIPERGWYAMALDGEGRPVDALASNVGHCLWTGIVDEDKAALVAERLLSPDVFTGFGLRTLAGSMVGFDPLSAHAGAVWPHDTALAAAGLMRYGFVEGAQALVLGLLDAATAGDGRLPELFGGLARDEHPWPISFPTSCSPKAVASAAPLLLLRTLLRFDPWLTRGRLWLSPQLPPEIGHLRVDRIPIGGRRVSIEVDGPSGKVEVEGLPPEVEVVTEPRPPLASTLG